MSIVTAGAGQFASDWANGINYGGIRRVSTSGEITHYKPTADTDVARGSALITACSDISTGDAMIINSGTYDVGNSGIDCRFDMSWIGIGQPVLKTISPVGVDKAGFYLGFDNEVNLSGITFRTDCSDADYGVGKATGHIYNVTNNNSGIVKDCQFVFNVTLTSIDASKSPKNFVNLGERESSMVNCVFHTLTTLAVGGSHGAFHADVGAFGAEYKTCENCKFLGENVSSAFEASPTVINCWMNLPSNLNLQLLNLYMARAFVPATSRALMDELKYIEFSRGISPDNYYFSAKVEIGTDWRTVFQIEDALSAVTPLAYEIEISASFFKAGSTTYQHYYHAIINNGVENIIFRHDTAEDVPTSTEVQFLPNIGSPDLFQLRERAAGQDWVAGHVKFKPINRESAISGAGNSSQFSTQISFIDISE